MSPKIALLFVLCFAFFIAASSCSALDLLSQQTSAPVETVASTAQANDFSENTSDVSGSSDSWKKGLSSFVKTTAVGLSFIAGGIAVASASPAIATALAAASVGTLGYHTYKNVASRLKQSEEAGDNSRALALAVGVGDTVGVSGVIEGINGTKLISGEKLSDDEAAELLGRSAGQLALTLGGGYIARANRVLLKPTSTSYVGYAHRFSSKKYAASTWKTGPWNKSANHRYSGPGDEALYAGTSKVTAAFEVRGTKGLEHHRTVMVQNRLLNLADPKVRKMLHTANKDITREGDYWLTQQFGTWARNQGYRGIIAPSAQVPKGKNIILFR